MKNKTLEKNFKFIADKKKDLLELYRMSCRDAISFYAEGSEITDGDDVYRVFSFIWGNNTKVAPSMDLAVLCGEFSKHQGIISVRPFADSEPESADFDHSQIAYMKNAFSDKAYRRFAEKFNRVSASYFAGFREVCEEVYYGRCSHAILPIFSSTDGQLPSFRQLISKYDLNIVCAVDIEMSDETFMRYALLKKGLSDSISDAKYLDISVVIDSGFKCGEFLSACEILGVKVIGTYSYPSEYSSSENNLYLIFDISHADVQALHLFFECSHIRYTPIGAYNVI